MANFHTPTGTCAEKSLWSEYYAYFRSCLKQQKVIAIRSLTFESATKNMSYEREDEHEYPLAPVCASGDLSHVQQLLDEGADVGFDCDSFGRSPWENAVAHGHLHVLQLLLTHQVDKQSERFWRRLLRAAICNGREDLVAFVLFTPSKDQVDWTQPTTDVLRESPLFLAVNLNRLDLAKLLLAQGMSVSERDPMGHTLLHIAAKYHGNEDIVMLLLAKHKEGAQTDHVAWINTLDKQQNTALHYAVEFNNPEMAALLIQAGVSVNQANSKGQMALHYAVMSARVGLVELLLVHGQADANVQDFKGNAPLHYVTSMDFSKLDHVDEDEDDVEGLHAQIAGLLLTHGADANLANDFGETPLLLAIRSEYERVVTLLLQHGADVNRTSPSIGGGAALHEAARMDAMQSIWTALVAYKADPSCKDAQGRTPLELVLNTDRRQELQALLAV